MEFLLFSSSTRFEVYFDDIVAKQIQGIIDSFENPEEINSVRETAPSKRLIQIIPEYDKVLYGNIEALEIGLQRILDKCPRFRTWIDSLVLRGSV
ncbi:MAG: DUF4276 family protein [Muribaculaceae bacterium]|nr:DUF4276 family protein [Muribaculaceae bacterium]